MIHYMNIVLILYSLRNMGVFEEHMQCTYLVFESLSPFYWKSFTGSLKRRQWPQFYSKDVIFSISARLRNFVYNSGLNE